MPKSATHKAIKSIKWSFLSEIAKRFLAPIFFLILVRILSPNDFGIFGTITAVLLFVDTFAHLGLHQGLIRLSKKEFSKSASSIFWFLWLFSIFLYIILYLLAPYLSSFYHAIEIKKALRIMSLSLLFPGTVYWAYLQKEFIFKKIFLFSLFTSSVPGLVAIPLAMHNLGVWALVYGYLINSIITFLYIFKVTSWQPKFELDFSIILQAVKKNFWIIIENLSLWFFIYGEYLIVGRYMGTNILGLYQAAFSFLSLIFTIFIFHNIPITYSLFSKLKSNPIKLKETIIKITRLIIAVTLPLGIGIALLAKPISTIIFGGRWIGIDLVILLLGIRFAFSQFLLVMPEALRAIGRADINAKLGLLGILYSLPIYIFAARYGLKTFIVATILITLFDNIIIYSYVIKKILKLKFNFYFRPAFYPIISTILMGLIIYLIQKVSPNFSQIFGIIKLIILILIAIISYFLVLNFFQKDLIKLIFRTLKKALT